VHALLDEAALCGPTGPVLGLARPNGYRRFICFTGDCSWGRPLAMAPLSNWDSITVIMAEQLLLHKDKGREIFHLLQKPGRR
jgi:hypothetical protein